MLVTRRGGAFDTGRLLQRSDDGGCGAPLKARRLRGDAHADPERHGYRGEANSLRDLQHHWRTIVDVG